MQILALWVHFPIRGCTYINSINWNLLIRMYKTITMNHKDDFYPQLVFEVTLLLSQKVIIYRHTWWGYLAYLHTLKYHSNVSHKNHTGIQCPSTRQIGIDQSKSMLISYLSSMSM